MLIYKNFFSINMQLLQLGIISIRRLRRTAKKVTLWICNLEVDVAPWVFQKNFLNEIILGEKFKDETGEESLEIVDANFSFACFKAKKFEMTRN